MIDWKTTHGLGPVIGRWARRLLKPTFHHITFRIGFATRGIWYSSQTGRTSSTSSASFDWLCNSVLKKQTEGYRQL